MSQFDLTEVGDGMGVQITGAQLNRPLESESQAEMRRLFAKYGLVIFRGEELSMSDQMRVLSYLAPVVDPFQEADPYITNRAGVWDGPIQYSELDFHADFAFFEEPPTILSLFGMEIEGNVAGTKFASGKRGYSRLPESLKLRVKDLNTRHALPQQVTRRSGDASSGVYYDRPLVLSSSNGDSFIHLSYLMFDKVVELDVSEGEALIQEICEYLLSPDNIYVHQWRTGDLVIWDNMAFQHARDNTAEGGARVLQKVVCANSPVSTRMPAAVREQIMGTGGANSTLFADGTLLSQSG